MKKVQVYNYILAAHRWQVLCVSVSLNTTEPHTNIMLSIQLLHLIILPHIFLFMHLILEINFLITLLSSSKIISEGLYSCVFAQVNVILFQFDYE